MFMFDWNYLVFISPAIVLSIIAAIWVKVAFARWDRRALSSQLSGAQAARLLLDASGLRDVQIERVHGFLSDHYDPRHKVLRLSPKVYDGRSVSAVGVAAHEAGHALQDRDRYAPLVWRSALVPIATLGSNLTWILLTIGVFFQISGLYTAAVFLFGGVVLFQLVTLPVEFNASSRAKEALASHGIVSQVELGGVSSVLTAAAMTYVAAALMAILQFVYFFLRSRD